MIIKTKGHNLVYHGVRAHSKPSSMVVSVQDVLQREGNPQSQVRKTVNKDLT